MAKSFGKVLLELAVKDPRICGVSCDCWGFIAPLAERFPHRAIEIGIAEQNLIGIAAGLAMQGKIPFAIGMNPFITMRCFEQVRTDLGYGARNVKVIGGYGSGISFGGWGCTHHAMEEIALMRLIPSMTVVMPADAWETEQALHAAAVTEGPFYIAVAGGNLPEIQPEEERSFTLGKATQLRGGSDVTVIATGSIASEAAAAGDKLAEMGIEAEILHIHTVKPIDREAILQAASTSKLVVTIEEHTVIGGLGGAVAEVLADTGAGVPLKRLGLQDLFAWTVGSHEDLKQRYGMTTRAIIDAVSEFTG